MTDDQPTDALARIASSRIDDKDPRVVYQDTVMGLPDTYRERADPWNPPHVLTRAELNGETVDHDQQTILIGGDVIDMGDHREATNLRVIGDSHGALFDPEWLKALMASDVPEPSHVRSQLDGIARMSFGSPGKPRRR